jgi:hypothetical protein
MEISISWHERQISPSARTFFDQLWRFDVDAISHEAGIYVLGRKHGKRVQPIYIGKATDLQQRIRQQMNNFRLMQALGEASNGARVVLVGEIESKRGQQVPRVLKVAERALIRAALASGHPIVNKHGTKTATHSISIIGKRPQRFPFEREIFAD